MSCGLSEVQPQHFLAGLRKSIKTHIVKISGVSDQIRTKHLSNRSLQFYHLSTNLNINVRKTII